MNPRLLLSKTDSNRYTLAALVGKRAREISDGSAPLVDCKQSKPVTMAMEELIQGKISYRQTRGSIK